MRSLTARGSFDSYILLVSWLWVRRLFFYFVDVGVGVGVGVGLFLSLNLLIIIWYILQV